MPIGPARMSLMEHLGELRMRIVRIIAVLIISILVFYFAAPTLVQFMLEPVAEYMPQDANGQALINILGAFDAFSLRIYVAFWASLVACSPVILWQILAFFLPALKPRERKWFVPTFAASVILFIGGTVFCYLVILDPAFEFLTGQASGFAAILPEAKQWVDIIIKFELGFGLAFELPLIVFYLVLFNIVPYEKLRASWRGVYVTLLIVSATITPDGSPVTMGLMFAVLLAMYELSLLIARIALRRRTEKLAEREARDAESMELAKEQIKGGIQDLKDARDRHFFEEGEGLIDVVASKRKESSKQLDSAADALADSVDGKDA